LQQTPSVQKPEAQSPSLLHTAPRGLGPQLPFTQRTPLTQSVLERQVTTQARVAGSQLNGAQIVAGPALQIVPAMCRRQPPLPSQVPSRPQVVTSDAGQTAGVRGEAPAGTSAQIPGEPWTLQARHVPVQSLLQQTPSTQKLL